MNASPSPTWQFDVARPDELPAALELALEHIPPADRPTRLLNALTLLAAGELDARGVFVARHGDSARACLVCQALPGTTGLLWLPRGEPAAFEPLIRMGLDWLQKRGCRLAQIIVGPDEEDLREPFHRSGFRPAGPLLYLRHPLESIPEPAGIPGFRFVPSTEIPESELCRTVSRTYEDTLDFPELTGVRSMPEVLAGHRAAGRHDPAHWLVALADAEPAGVCFVTELDPLESWDLTYLGVVPEFRHRGLARALTIAGLGRVREGGGSQLEVAVDVRNAPALQLYASLGFMAAGTRLVSLYAFPSSEAPSSEDS